MTRLAPKTPRIQHRGFAILPALWLNFSCGIWAKKILERESAMMNELNTESALRSSRRIFIDHTHTTHSGYQTGVQRVVRKICEHAPSTVTEAFDEVIPVVLGSEGFHPCQPQNVVVGNVQKDQSDLCVQPSNSTRSSWHRLAKSLRKRIDRLQIRFRSVATGALAGLPMENNHPTIQFSKGDTLLLPDAYWALPTIWPWVQRARREGVQTAIIIYDLIPHTHSEMYSSEGADNFRRYIRSACEHADCLVAISKTVKNQLFEHLPAIIGRSASQFIVSAFELGAEFSQTSEPVRNDVLQAFACKHHELPYLMVGTIEARKNHVFTLDAMEQLWADFPQRRLCIVGRGGWKGETVIERVVNHARYGKQLFWINNASDADLLHCYAHAHGVIFPSVTEGFGLPIVESLWHGRDTFASDIPIHREVGKNRCKYFSLDNVDSLVEILRLKETSAKDSLAAGSVQDNSNRKHLLTWSESVHQLMQVISHSLNQVGNVTRSRSDMRRAA